MKQLFAFFILLICLPFTGMGQKDFIITRNRDTIRGNINWYSGGKITIKTSSGKQRYAYEDILGYKDANRLYEVIKSSRKDGKVIYTGMQVMADGKVRLLLHCSQCQIYYILINKECIYVNARNLQDKIFPKLSACEKFLSEYKDYPQDQFSKLARSYKKLEEMVKFYNASCN